MPGPHLRPGRRGDHGTHYFRTGCCPGTNPFSPVSIERVTAESVTEEGSWLSADLVSDRDLTLIRGLRLYELSDIMYTTEVQYHNNNTLSSTIVYY